MKVALVHDFLIEFGGAERVLEALCEIYPKAPIYTAFYKKGSTAYERFKNKKIVASWAHHVPFFASKLHSPLRFLAPKIWNSFDFSNYDLVISSSSWYITRGFKGAKGDKEFVEICYCHTPPRYLYGYRTSVDYKKNPLIKAYAIFVNHFIRMYDYEAAQRVDYFVANSEEVKRRIQKFYRRESKVIYPPVDVDRFSRGPVTSFPPVSARSKLKPKGNQKDNVELRAVGIPSTGATPQENGYFLSVSRLVGAKNVDLIVEVCKKLNLPLKIVGTGREMQALKELATRNKKQETRNKIEFLGEVDDKNLIDLYQNCRAVIFAASQEDFGIVPVEAMAAGKPVIALAEGGVLETVVDGKTGVYFDWATPESLTIAIKNFEKLEKNGAFDPEFIQAHAQKFSKERFKREILKFVESKTK